MAASLSPTAAGSNGGAARAKYFENLDKRTLKRDNDRDWKKMQNSNLASFVKEENIMLRN